MPRPYTIPYSPGDTVAIVGSKPVMKECPVCLGGDLDGTDVVSSRNITIVVLAGYRLPCPMCAGLGSVDTGENRCQALTAEVESVYVSRVHDQYTALVVGEKYARHVPGDRVFPTLADAEAASEHWNTSALAR